MTARSQWLLHFPMKFFHSIWERFFFFFLLPFVPTQPLFCLPPILCEANWLSNSLTFTARFKTHGCATQTRGLRWVVCLSPPARSGNMEVRTVVFSVSLPVGRRIDVYRRRHRCVSFWVNTWVNLQVSNVNRQGDWNRHRPGRPAAQHVSPWPAAFFSHSDQPALSSLQAEEVRMISEGCRHSLSSTYPVTLNRWKILWPKGMGGFSSLASFGIFSAKQASDLAAAADRWQDLFRSAAPGRRC